MNGVLIDGTGAPPLVGSAVLVDDGRIAWVGPAGAFEAAEGVEVVDVAGTWVVPGLLDANVHLVSDLMPDVLLRYDIGDYDELVLEAAQVALKAGITTVFDTWGPLDALKRVRDGIDDGALVGSRIRIAGNIIGNSGPYGVDFLPQFGELLNDGVVERINAVWEQGVGDDLTWMTVEGVREAAREYIGTSGIDFVKYTSSSHSDGRFLAFSTDAQRAICEEAHAAGMTAQACTQSPQALDAAIEAGVDLLQHGDITGYYPMPDATVELIAGRQLPCVAFLMTDAHMETLSDTWRGGIWKERSFVRDQNARRLIDAGAKLALANDMGVYSSESKSSSLFGDLVGQVDDPRELGVAHTYWIRAAVERGMSPMDALLCATRNIADAYHVLDDLGTLEVGKRADLLILDADPLADPDNYLRIAHVVKDGEVVDLDLLPETPVLT
jgi:imidazolonepropionase-like amidohydrolase